MERSTANNPPLHYLLWDGTNYPAALIESKYPAVFDVVAQGRPLADHFSVDYDRLIRAWRRAMLISLGLSVCPFGAIAVVAAAVGEFSTALFLLFGILLFVLSSVGSLSFIRSRIIRQLHFNTPRTVVIDRGTVCVSSPAGERSYPLSQCYWWRGRSYHDLLHCFGIPVHRAVLLVCPTEGIDRVVAIGKTSRSLREFDQFFQLANVSKVYDGFRLAKSLGRAAAVTTVTLPLQLVMALLLGWIIDLPHMFAASLLTLTFSTLISLFLSNSVIPMSGPLSSKFRVALAYAFAIAWMLIGYCVALWIGSSKFGIVAASVTYGLIGCFFGFYFALKVGQSSGEA